MGFTVNLSKALYQTILGGSWDLVSKVIGTLIGVLGIVTLKLNPRY